MEWSSRGHCRAWDAWLGMGRAGMARNRPQIGSLFAPLSFTCVIFARRQGAPRGRLRVRVRVPRGPLMMGSLEPMGSLGPMATQRGREGSRVIGVKAFVTGKE